MVSVDFDIGKICLGLVQEACQVLHVFDRAKNFINISKRSKKSSESPDLIHLIPEIRVLGSPTHTLHNQQPTNPSYSHICLLSKDTQAAYTILY